MDVASSINRKSSSSSVSAGIISRFTSGVKSSRSENIPRDKLESALGSVMTEIAAKKDSKSFKLQNQMELIQKLGNEKLAGDYMALADYLKGSENKGESSFDSLINWVDSFIAQNNLLTYLENQDAGKSQAASWFSEISLDVSIKMTGDNPLSVIVNIDFNQTEFSSTSVSSTTKAGSVSKDKALAYIDPLVIDLNGDGLSFTGYENGANFDIDANGETEKVSWVKGDDAILFLDKNGNGNLDNGGEMFGDMLGHSDGFAALRALDSNADNWIDVHDPAFHKLYLYQDANGDGMVSPWECTPVASSGVARISASSKSEYGKMSSGDIHLSRSKWVDSKGDVHGGVSDIAWLMEKKSQ